MYTESLLPRHGFVTLEKINEYTLNQGQMSVKNFMDKWLNSGLFCSGVSQERQHYHWQHLSSGDLLV